MVFISLKFVSINIIFWLKESEFCDVSLVSFVFFSHFSMNNWKAGVGITIVSAALASWYFMRSSRPKDKQETR